MVMREQQNCLYCICLSVSFAESETISSRNKYVQCCLITIILYTQMRLYKVINCGKKSLISLPTSVTSLSLKSRSFAVYEGISFKLEV